MKRKINRQNQFRYGVQYLKPWFHLVLHEDGTHKTVIQ